MILIIALINCSKFLGRYVSVEFSSYMLTRLQARAGILGKASAGRLALSPPSTYILFPQATGSKSRGIADDALHATLTGIFG